MIKCVPSSGMMASQSLDQCPWTLSEKEEGEEVPGIYQIFSKKSVARVINMYVMRIMSTFFEGDGFSTTASESFEVVGERRAA